MKPVANFLLAVSLVMSVGGCVSQGDGSSVAPGPPNIRPGGLPPAPGRDEAERQVRKTYYGGPRGDEFY